MASSLASQLAQIAAESKASLDTKAQKAAHSKSLIWEPRVAATQSYQTLYATCIKGFQELCRLDSRFALFQSTLFSTESQNQDRTQLTIAENEQLDKQVEAFLRLAGSRLRLMPAVKSIEWLIRRFRIHEENTAVLLMTFLPYHSITAFVTLLSILPSRVPQQFRFLDPYIRSLTAPPRSVFVHQAIQHPDFLSAVSEYTLESCRMQYQYPALIAFWGGFITEAVSGLVDKSKSGRAAIQSENTQNLLHRLGPVFADSLVMKKVPSLQIASYMALAVFVSKADLNDVAVMAFMEQTVHGWTANTVRTGLVCLVIMAQQRSAKQLSSKVTKALIKVPGIGSLLLDISQQRRIDKLANGLCLALIERITKKGESRGLPIVICLLNVSILKERQIAVNFKSLLLAALRLDDENDADGALRRELGTALIGLSRAPGTLGEIVQRVIAEAEFDLEELEMKLDLSFRSRKIEASTVAEDSATPQSNDATKAYDLGKAIEQVSSSKQTLPTCLAPQAKEVFDEFSHLFFSIVSDRSRNAGLLSQFDQSPKLRRSSATDDATYFSFFIRIWCGPYPAMARSAAFDMVKDRLKAETALDADMQALVPYCIVGLSDPSKRVRQAAADLLAIITQLHPLQKPDLKKTWGTGLYGDTSKVATIQSELLVKMLHLQLLPAAEECVMDAGHIAEVLRSALEQGKFATAPDAQAGKKNHMPQKARLDIFSFLAGHAIATPIIAARQKLVKSLNKIAKISSTTRTEVLLPLLQWWIEIPGSEAATVCEEEKLDRASLNKDIIDILVPNDTAGLEFIVQTLRSPAESASEELYEAIFARLYEMWPMMKQDRQYLLAENLLDISQKSASADSVESTVAIDAADFLRRVPLTTDILLFFLGSIHTGTKMITEPLPSKRRRTSAVEPNRNAITQVTPELSQALRKMTFVLQVVENSDALAHPELLAGLFTSLSELQHFRTVVGSELGYLQNLILRSLLAMMPAYKGSKELQIDSSGGYGDLLVNCIQKSSSPVVQNAALLLIASLAATAPSLVLHSVMPIFTFMGTSVLRQSDDYSAHVVSQTIKEVVPPLMVALRKGQKGVLAGASDILVSFTTAFEHIPPHRRQGLFVALVETLGPRDFLYAIVGMLVDRYGSQEYMLNFIIELLNNFSASIQLDGLSKILDLVADLFKPKPTTSLAVLGLAQDTEAKNTDKLAVQQMSAFPSFLANKQLKPQIERMAENDDMEAAQMRELYASLLEKTLLLADSVKGNKTVHNSCGATLFNLLNLLSIGEYIKAVENLLDRPDTGLRQKVLRSLEVRVEAESKMDASSRTALLAFMPQLIAAIRESDDIRYKHTAVTCIDKIAEKYGKKDIEAVVAAAITIAGEHCLGQDDQRLQVMALLCLTSLVDVLQDAVVPVLPTALPTTLAYLSSSMKSDALDEELHSACYGFLSSLAEHLPNMLSPYLESVFEISSRSAETKLSAEGADSRTSCLRFLGERVDAKGIFSALDESWDSATSAGALAVLEYLDTFGQVVDKHPRSVIVKNKKHVVSILMKGLDLRRQVHSTGGPGNAVKTHLDNIEKSLFEKAVVMVSKLNDTSFRPVFNSIVEWADSGLSKKDHTGQGLRLITVFKFFEAFFAGLKTAVTAYATYIVDDVVKILGRTDPATAIGRQLWSQALKTLTQCFQYDQIDFWQAPARFSAIAPALMKQFGHARILDLGEDLIPAVVALAIAAESQDHRKELNAALLKHLRSEDARVRLAAVQCEQALTDKPELGEEWLSMLHEMLPRISELQDDDDEEVERETHRWIVKIEGVLGESLDAMLQ